ncbi:tetratricopeptide repeat protein [Chitinophaga sp. 212800010-3]|uniref:tetratricopeptide repeat protein n=1 Tax=unclassified Chitinophaga TaxID=2619133 RepID=UPI002E105BE6
MKRYSIIIYFLAVSLSVSAQRSGLVSSDVLLKMALEARRDQKDYPKAIKLCKKALAQSPNYTDIRILLGQLYKETGNPVAAAFEWNVALKNDPGNTDVMHDLVNLYYGEGKISEAVCYVDLLLEKEPTNKDLLIKKYGLVQESGDVQGQAGMITKLRTLYPADSTVNRLVKDYQLSAANSGRKSGNLEGARKMYEQSLQANSHNKEALEGMATVLASQGRGLEAIRYYDQLLQLDPHNTTYRLKRSSIRLAAGQYAAALEDAQQLYRANPGQNQFRQHLTDVYEGMMKTAPDPAVYAEQLVTLQPRNKSVYEVLMNQAYKQDEYETALNWSNKALAAFPGDEDLLRRKAGIQEKQGDYAGAAATAAELLQVRRSAVNEQIYTDLQVANANRLIRSGQTAAAATVLETALAKLPRRKEFLAPLSNVKALQGKPQEAVALLDQQLAGQPQDTALLLKKSGLLESMHEYAAAAAISRQLVTAYPNSQLFRQVAADQQLLIARDAMQAGRYQPAKQALQTVLQLMPSNRDAHIYLVNLEYQQGNKQAALDAISNAYTYLGKDSLLLQKQSAILEQLGRYREASAISAALCQAFPADTALRNMYGGQLLEEGKRLRQLQQWDSAQLAYQQALTVGGPDTTAFMGLTAVAAARHQYDSVISYANKGLALSPANQALLSQKAGALEKLHRYREAAVVANQLYAQDPREKKWRDYADHLDAYGYQNQAGVTWLQSAYSKDFRPASVLSLQYMRRYDRGSILGRVNYASREAGDGIQLEAETYYKHNPKYYSYAYLGWADSKVFPTLRVGYSLFRNFNKGWEAELGARYVRTDSINNYSAVASVAKTWGNYWVNLRGFLTADDQRWYQAYTLTNRFYLHEQKDFIALIGSVGTSPDDRSRNYQLGRVAGLTATSLTAGYQKLIRGRATVGAYTTFTNQQLAPGRYVNQYDAYLLFLWNF